jgi:hypothetical protein
VGQALNSLDAFPLMETEGATQPFWSPDGRSLGFFAGGQLKRTEVMSGSWPLSARPSKPRAAHGTRTM